MRSDWVISGAGHLALLVAGLVTLANSKPIDDPADYVPVSIVTDADVSRAALGQKNAPLMPRPKPLADKIGELKQVDQIAPKVTDKPAITTNSPTPMPMPKPEVKTGAEDGSEDRAAKTRPEEDRRLQGRQDCRAVEEDHAAEAEGQADARGAQIRRQPDCPIARPPRGAASSGDGRHAQQHGGAGRGIGFAECAIVADRDRCLARAYPRLLESRRLALTPTPISTSRYGFCSNPTDPWRKCRSSWPAAHRRWGRRLPKAVSARCSCVSHSRCSSPSITRNGRTLRWTSILAISPTNQRSQKR